MWKQHEEGNLITKILTPSLVKFGRVLIILYHLNLPASIVAVNCSNQIYPGVPLGCRSMILPLNYDLRTYYTQFGQSNSHTLSQN